MEGATDRNLRSRAIGALAARTCCRITGFCFGLCLVQELPRLRAIQSPNPGGLNNGRIEDAEIDAHSALGATDWLPVRDAATVGAAKGPEVFVSPAVMIQSPLACDNSHLASVVVGPEPTVAATD